jgi:prepilin-type N-terminal cleavage/methylation domain-containing protein
MANDKDTSFRRAFSLIELLVVIGIIGILVAMVFPTFSKVREQAKAVQCMAQLHQLGQAFVMYANANAGYTPTWSGVHLYAQSQFDKPNPTDNKGWTELLMPYYTKPDSPVYRCPAFQGEYITYFIAARWEGINEVHNIKLSRIRTSTSFMLSGDCTAPQWYLPPFGTAVTPQDDCDKDDATVQCLLFRGDKNGINMHHGGNNVLFSDLHVSTIKAWDSNSLTYSPNKMQGYDAVTQDEQ